MARLCLWCGVSLVMACAAPCSNSEPVVGLDGGTVACVQATSCPRPSSVLVCGQTQDATGECMACENNRCVHHRPELCP